MSYKTKFREVKVPRNEREIKAIGTDANSLRSLAAAHYRQLAGLFPADVRHKAIALMLEGSQQVLEPYLQETNPSALPIAERQMRYFAQGFQRAAKAASDEKTIEYVSRRLAEQK